MHCHRTQVQTRLIEDNCMGTADVFRHLRNFPLYRTKNEPQEAIIFFWQWTTYTDDDTLYAYKDRIEFYY